MKTNEGDISRNHLMWWLIGLMATVILADQILKIWVKTHFWLGEDMPITSWFQLKFIENNGFAFGIEWLNKYVLTFGRIAAVGLFIWMLGKFLKMKEATPGFLVCFSLIIAGAAGNIFDCVFYGVIFNNPMPPEVAVAFPYGGGYAGWFEGRVVDMLYFPIFSIDIPSDWPIIGGIHWEFFQYIFNIADSAITIGVLAMILFCYRPASIATNQLFNKSSFNKKDMVD